MNRLTLEPEAHGPACRMFFSHFDIYPQRPSLQDLQILLAGFSHLPYENLSKIIKLNKHGNDPARLRLPEEVIDDHCRWHLGGTCFSLTFLLQAVLVHAGYVCYPVMADMRAGRNVHCALIVEHEHTKYLVDPGYLLGRPLALDPACGRLYHTEFSGVELVYDAVSCNYQLYTFSRHEMKWRYCFSDRPVPVVEFLEHWQTSFSRNSMHGLCLTCVRGDNLIYVHNGFMRQSSWQGKRNFNVKHNLHITIEDIFKIPAEFVEQAQAALMENLRRERSQLADHSHER